VISFIVLQENLFLHPKKPKSAAIVLVAQRMSSAALLVLSEIEGSEHCESNGPAAAICYVFDFYIILSIIQDRVKPTKEN